MTPQENKEMLQDRLAAVKMERTAVSALYLAALDCGDKEAEAISGELLLPLKNYEEWLEAKLK